MTVEQLVAYAATTRRRGYLIAGWVQIILAVALWVLILIVPAAVNRNLVVWPKVVTVGVIAGLLLMIGGAITLGTSPPRAVSKTR